MDTITLSVEIPEDRHLVIDLPADTPVGQAVVIIKPYPQTYEDATNPAREAARATLRAAGVLGTAHHAPAGAIPLSDEELQRLGQKHPGATSLDDLINTDRGEY